jgi:hypothetical protein
MEDGFGQAARYAADTLEAAEPAKGLFNLRRQGAC